MANRRRDRARAEAAIGRPLTKQEIVHHHSATQLVICDHSYHRWLHGRMRRYGMPDPYVDGYIGFRLNHRMVKKLDAIAAKAGRTRANYLRMLLSDVIARGGLSVRET